MKKVLFLALLVGFSAIIACNKDKKRAETQRKQILSDLSDKGLTATEDASGIFYIIDTPGDSSHPDINSLIEFTYKGYLLDGQVFDQSSIPVKYRLYDLIEGWQVCIPFLGKGGHGTFWIPSELGYGGNPQSGIPAHSVLIFEIGLKDFE